MPRVARPVTRYGVNEWFGQIVSDMTAPRRAQLSTKATLSVGHAAMPCPFRQSIDPDAQCNKKGGVCSLRSHRREIDSNSERTVVVPDGPFVTVCPSRFWQNNSIFRWIGETVIGSASPILVKEVEFLESLSGDQSEQGEGAAVGRIDSILINPSDRREWCAVEMQSVYFSGAGMASHLAQFNDQSAGLPWPDATRRPDFRSSGPKRLMPQLQTKVPTLRRWGRKMVTVVDRPFFASLGTLTSISHLSNADIAWFVVDYDARTGAIKLNETIYTTLESSVEALTAGAPLSKEEFESEIDRILRSDDPAMQRKVIRLSH